MNAKPILLKPRIAVIDGKVTTTSLVVAAHFGKLHKNVLRDIENLSKHVSPAFHRLNFELTSAEVAQPNGGTRKEPAYRLTRDGFAMLAMGFTGQKAIRWKEAYINAFNALEQGLLKLGSTPAGDGQHFPDRMTPKQFLELYYALDRQLVSAAILWQLIQMGAHRSPVRASIRELIRELGNGLSAGGVHKAARRLDAGGLIDVARSQWAATEWFVFEKAVRSRLSEALTLIEEQPGLDLDEAWTDLLPRKEELH